MCKKRFVLIAKTYDKRGRLIAVGTNLYKKSHPFQASLAEKVGLPEKKFLHAEIATLLSSRTKTVHKLTIERYTSEGKLALAKPCLVCQSAIDLFGVKIVEYTTSEGWVKEKY